MSRGGGKAEADAGAGAESQSQRRERDRREAELAGLLADRLKDGPIADTSALPGVDHALVPGAVTKLVALYNLQGVVPLREVSAWALTAEGQQARDEGSVEARALALIVEATKSERGGIYSDELASKMGVDASAIKLAQGNLAKLVVNGRPNQYLVVKPDDRPPVEGTEKEKKEKHTIISASPYALATPYVDTVSALLGTSPLSAVEGGEKTLAGLKQRKLVVQRAYNCYSLPQLTNKPVKDESLWRNSLRELRHLPDQAWRHTKVSRVNWAKTRVKQTGPDGQEREVVMPLRPDRGYAHPLLKMRAQVRNVFLKMGFEEMPTDDFVDSSFWNFDSLFQPQHHPARDAHDTFFLSYPARTENLPCDYVQAVKTVHETGADTGSFGYQYAWDENEARTNVLRTHTTAVSARMLYQLGQVYKRTGRFERRKLFSIDRVFRNEATDATHLMEFHQIEGLICDRNLGLQDLLHAVATFFKKLGMTGDLRFKPAYNPYTEPSVEIHHWSEQLGRYVEIGNSGVFRPEMLLPMGLPADASVIAWGLSLERPAMQLYKIKDIRELFGNKINLERIKQAPIYALYDADNLKKEIGA